MQQIIEKLTRLSFISLLLLISGNFPAYAAANVFDELVDHPKIPMLDGDGVNVLDSGNPYSPKKTCEGSGCHDYDAINHAYHFEMGRDEADDHFGKKRGLPHLVSPGYFGGYTCMGGSNPIVLAKKNNASAEEFGDWGAAGWVKDCANCHAGGGFAELDRDGIRYDEKDISTVKEFDGDYYDRVKQDDGTTKVVPHDWKKSGVVEADCMLCHAKFADLAVAEGSLIDQPVDNRRGPGGWVRSQRGDFAEEGYFRETGSTIIEAMKNKEGVNMLTFSRSETQVHNHMTGEMETGVGLDLDENGKPILNWNAAAFDAEKRVVIPMLRFPDNDNCMACHRTSNSRRGFYGFGDDAVMTPETEDGIESTGVIVDDYKDDVHKGKVFTDDNGESRTIDNCNACHAKQYYKPLGAPIDLDANHDFPKGNSDMDVRNDLDYAPNAMSCEYCHETAVNNVVPSGHDDMLDAHLELWKSNGDMAGYTAGTLTKITQTHLDVVGCQTCHITNKRGSVDDAMLYRYREAEDGKQKIIPYKPRYRYYWKDAVTGDVLVKNDRNAIFKEGKNADGETEGIIFDPVTGTEFGRVSARISHGSLRFSDPDDYAGYVAMKTAYDSVLRAKGYTAPNAVMVWTESNEYVISHNTRPSPESMPCGDCHAKKQGGAFSSLLSVEGVLGEANSKEVTTLPDKRLVDEGIVILDLEYMKIDAEGKVTENVSDILFATKVDPFMTLLQKKGIDTLAESIGSFAGVAENAAVFTDLGLNDADKAKLAARLQSGSAFVFKANATNADMRGLAVIADAESSINAKVLPSYRVMLGKLNEKGIEAAKEVLNASDLGNLSSSVIYFRAHDDQRKLVNTMAGGDVLLKVPYQGTKTDASAVNVAYIDWKVDAVNTVDEADIVAIQPRTEAGEGYVIFKASATGFYFVAE